MRDLIVPALSVIWMAMILYIAWQAWSEPEVTDADLESLEKELGIVPIPADTE